MHWRKMNVQAQMSGQISEQVPNQTGSQFLRLAQQNGSSVPNQRQGLGGHHNAMNNGPQLHHRKFMQEKIHQFLLHRNQQARDVHPTKLQDAVKRLEVLLLRKASSLEEYLDISTLGHRLAALCRTSQNNSSRTYAHAQFGSSSSSIGTMIPTPGMPCSGNSSIMNSSPANSSPSAASGSNSIAPATGTTTSSLSNIKEPLVGMHGPMANRYPQAPANFAIKSSANSIVSSSCEQRMTSQMIPTPGFDISKTGAASTAESATVSQPQQRKQLVGVQNTRKLQSLDSPIGSIVRPGLQQRAYGLPNRALNGCSRMKGGIPLAGSETADGYQLTAPYGNSLKPSPPQSDQHQRTVPQGDPYRMSAPDSSGSGNVFGPVTSSSSALNNQNLNPANLLGTSTNSSLKTNQLNLHKNQQAAHIMSQSTDPLKRLNFQGANALQENLLKPHQRDVCWQPRASLQQQFIHDQSQQKRQHQQHVALVKNEPLADSDFTSNLSYQLKPEHGMQGHDNDLHSRDSEQFQCSVLHNELLQSSAADHSRSSQMVSLPPMGQEISSLRTQTSQQMELMHSQVPAASSLKDSSCPSVGLQTERILSDQWHPKSQDGFELPGNMVHEQNLQEDFRQRIIVRDEAQRNNLSSEASNGQIVTETAQPPSACNYIIRTGNPNRDRQFFMQIKWLLFLIHARNCSEEKCQDANCPSAGKLWKHMDNCKLSQCPYPRCRDSRILVQHYKTCKSPLCPVCSPARKFVETQKKRCALADSKLNLPCSASSQRKVHDGGVAVETSDDVQHSLKRIKTEESFQSLLPGSETSAVLALSGDSPVCHNTQRQDYQQGDTCMSVKDEASKAKSEVPSNTGHASSSITDLKKDRMDYTYNQNPVGKLILSGESVQEECIKVETDLDQSKPRNVTLPAEIGSATKSAKPKVKGVSMIELFTPEQVREHVMSLRQWVGQTKVKAEKNQAMEYSMSENSCQLCAVERLAFEPPPIYCTPCGIRIKRNAVYYTVGAGETQHWFCGSCYSDTRGDTILVDGAVMSKERLEKKRNNEELEEAWVQCDKCEAWQHQICALFNWRRNDGGQAEYICPNCYLAEVEKGERMPLPQTAVLGAKDLPRTILSDHLEQRLSGRLKQERQERARLQGKSYDEVPGAEALVIRVVSSVDKKLEVKQRFLEIFQEENYPTEFPYKSKVVLLFQKIEGVEVCLFGMYVQEFGSECEQPNHRRVYLSYLDSVKYFRPDIKAVTGEALRTFVYHEILIGYLEYCKKRGFTSCYIWACPPLKGEDYILYCHPEIQKTPKSDKLREWYLSMLRKASKENIVVDLTNFYDQFFLTTGECKAKVTAARLPYFDGDYWPGAAEDLIGQLHQEEDGRKLHKKGTIKKTLTKRALRASGYNISGNASKDILLMHKLGETISPMKEDFIMVHLQHACTHCCALMASGNRWVCNQCKNFQLCDKCYQVEQKAEDRDRHPINQKDKHLLCQIEINDVPEETKDKDDIIESEFFDTRQAFLSLCQGNHYQYDTLRRAKHSSMMVLYHLHNPTAPAFAITCNICHLDVEAGQGWRCEVCADYDVCKTCYQRDGGINHPHKLTNHPSMGDCDAQSGEAREMRVAQLKKMLELLVHASHCRSINCQYPNCRKVKGLFRHGIHCKIRASGGCNVCKKMWHLLQLHARACKVSECTVPRCRDLKVHLRRAQQQAESRRRAAVKEMMRQRTAEVAAGNAR